MGANTCLVVTSNTDPKPILAQRPSMDVDAARDLAGRLFPKLKLEPQGSATLLNTNVAEDEVLIGVFPGATIIAADEVGDLIGEDPRRYLESTGHRRAIAHVMNSVVDLCAFSVWEEAGLRRALGMSASDGIFIDEGHRLPFELPYWNGEYPAVDPEDPDAASYPFPFHPLELGEAALSELFGFVIEGPPAGSLYDPEDVELQRFQTKRRTLKFS